MSPLALQQCRECGHLGNKILGSIQGLCATCVTKPEARFRVVREYLIAHPQSNALAVANATGVRHSEVLSLISDGRLQRFSTATDDAAN